MRSVPHPLDSAPALWQWTRRAGSSCRLTPPIPLKKKGRQGGVELTFERWRVRTLCPETGLRANRAFSPFSRKRVGMPEKGNMTDWVQNGLVGADPHNLTARQLAIVRNEMPGMYRALVAEGLPKKGNGRNTRFDFWVADAWFRERERVVHSMTYEEVLALMGGAK
jgi:hypothetical protein